MTRFAKWLWLCLFFAVTVTASPAQTFQTIVSFDSANGTNPQFMSLVQGTDGNFYGTTPYGGGLGVGEVFEVTSGGDLTELSDFSGSDDGYPLAGVIQATDGNLYGTTWQGGANNTGTVFELTAGGTLTILYSFCSLSDCADGDEPFAPLIQAKDGNFYGTTLDGGAKGYGTVFEVTLSSTLTTLHSFSYQDGASPVAGLIQAKNGKFYGTTLYGGAHGAGTVFEINSTGKLKALHSFGGSGDGVNPYLGLVQATNGNFYGTTYAGGAHGHGTVFQITAAGKLTILYSFCSQKKCTDGSDPYAGVIQATDGNFYGTTSKGGASNWGTVFAITAAGKLTTLHSFCSKKNCTDGAEPSGGLIQATSGTFYGTTTEGGAYQDGTVFSLSTGLGPFAEAEAASAQTETPKR
jgi:uncharacterized repeat protein (TIGR03803 family)